MESGAALEGEKTTYSDVYGSLYASSPLILAIILTDDSASPRGLLDIISKLWEGMVADIFEYLWSLNQIAERGGNQSYL